VETAKGKTREEILNRLADRIDTFEKYNQPHSKLMAQLVTRLARRFGLPTPDVDAITEAATLHDIGLYAMSPSYHPLPRPLSFETRLDLWRHPVIGEQQMAKRDASRHAQLLVRWHHEWWNGSGYPDMLAFEDIPIGARILRAVELYSALLCERPYRGALDHEQARETLAASAGIECDPYVVKALLALIEELFAGIERENASVETEATNVSAVVEPSPATEPQSWIQPSQTESSIQVPFDFGAQVANAPTINDVAEQVSVDSNNEAVQQWPGADQSASTEQQFAFHAVDEHKPNELFFTAAPPSHKAPARPAIESLLLRAQSNEISDSYSKHWRGWRGSRYNDKFLLGFRASVLRQIEFRSIAIPYLNEARLDWYLKTWGKLIFANDPRAWAGTIARANVEASAELGEDIISHILEDVYIPRVRLSNPDLRRWFGESDAWWMDNLRSNIDTLPDELTRAQALTLGLQTGDYALSFNEETRELRRPLTTVYWQLAGRAGAGPPGNEHNRCFNQPADEFIKHARADVLFLNLPSSRTERGGAESRSDWREAWLAGSPRSEADETASLAIVPQSKKSCLASIDRMLRLASHFKTWAIECHEPGLTTAQDIVDLIKEYRLVRATYSKDVTEVAGGLRNYIIVAEASSR